VEGKVEAVCLGKVKSQPKQEQSEINLQPGIGVIGDGHAGTEKEVSLLAREDLERFIQETGIQAPPGSFAENINTRGISLVDLAPGICLTLGETEIEIIAIGKESSLSHTYSYKGHSLLPTRGVFARVIRGGKVRKGDPINKIANKK
jgi:MOSC domain-containing protein YiiM